MATRGEEASPDPHGATTAEVLTAHLVELGPCLVGATGGSGTRVFARIVRRAGLFIGTNLNVSEDAVDLGAYSDRWINTFMDWRARPLPPAVEADMRRDLDAVFEHHLAPLAGRPRPWGWKEPRCIYLLPFFHERFPALRFLHVLRDGRDMAYSPNQNQLTRHGQTLLQPAEAAWPQPVRSAALWSRLNLLCPALLTSRGSLGEASLNRRDSTAEEVRSEGV